MNSDPGRFGIVALVVPAALLGAFAIAGLIGLNNWYVKVHSSDVPLSSLSLPACPQPTPGAAMNGEEPGPNWSGPALEITTLDTHAFASCNLGGVVVRFPDGFTMLVPPLGGVSGLSRGDGTHCTPSYEIVNSGTWGIAADRVSGDGKRTDWWGNGKAVEELRIAEDNHGTPDTPPEQCKRD